MIGSGKSHIRTVVSIAQAQARDQDPPPAVKAFASLGGFGNCSANEERDMHRWLEGLHGIALEVYNVQFKMHVLRLTNDSIKRFVWSMSKTYNWPFEPPTFLSLTEVVDSMELETVSIPVLLPHEVLHALYCAGSKQANGQNDVVLC